MSTRAQPFKAVLFDKDGTLFDFRKTWDVWAADLLPSLCNQDEVTLQKLAHALGYDLSAQAFLPHSIVIAGSNREIAAAIATVLQRDDVDRVEEELAASAATAPLAPAVALAPFLQGLKADGYKLGVMTNDAETVADAHLSAAGVRDMFDFVCGSDSGFGAKPDPAPLLAFCDHVGVAAAQTIMLGDSTHDLVAARAAGMTGLGVLTGIAPRGELAAFAQSVLPDIGALPAWLIENSAQE